MTKPTNCVHLAKTQISLGIRPDSSEAPLCAHCEAKDPSFLHVDSKDSDQTVMRQLETCCEYSLALPPQSDSNQYPHVLTEN